MQLLKQSSASALLKMNELMHNMRKQEIALSLQDEL